MEEIGAGCYKRCDAGHTSPELYRGKVGIESDAESAGSTTKKGFGQDVADRALLRVDQDHPKGELVPGL